MREELIIIPAFNEEENIGKVLDDLKKLYSKIDIVVIDDGSIDNTKEIAVSRNVAVVSHVFNLGYGAALQTGFKYAVSKGYKYIIQFDADGQHDSKHIGSMIEELKKEEADIIIGSRFLHKTGFSVGFLKGIVITLMSFIIKSTTGVRVTDPTSGFKGLSRKTFKYYSIMGNFPGDYPDADIIIQMLRLKYRVSEISIRSRPREFGQSMHSGLKPIVYLLKIMLSIIVILLREKFGRR